MKILYVEDELTKNIDRLRRLFSNYLDEPTIAELKRLETDGYGAKPQEIKNIIKAKSIIEIEDRFPDALRKIVYGYDQYACFIVDRNLVENHYDPREVFGIDGNYTETLDKKYRTREGDYLLNWLIMNAKEPKSILRKFHFLTAHNDSDLRGVDIIEMYLDFGAFTQEQFFDKTSLDKLKERIDNIAVLNIRYQNRLYLDILRNNLHEEDAEMFLKVLMEKDERIRINNNLSDIRTIYEHILEKFAVGIPQNKDENRTDYMKRFFKQLKDQKQINQMLRNYCFTIWQVCSDYGSHTDKKPDTDRIFQPTLNSINTIIYALREVILWLGDQFQQKK
ncbi:MAG: hypothetical protein ACOYOS_17490 [Syntrophales bacterium]